jgi:hypothetical protein
MGVAIFNGSTVDRVMGVGLVKITPNCIFGHPTRKKDKVENEKEVHY